MDNLFFIASKTIGMAARAETWMILGLVLAISAMWRNRRRLAIGAALFSFALLTGLTIWPLGDPLIRSLETQFPQNPPLSQVDGIIVLGGAEVPGVYREWGSTQLNDAGERMIAGVVLAARFPKARLIFTGGDAGLFYNGPTIYPSRMTKELWLDLGVAADRIVLESKSRNTAENARFTYDLITPKPDETFVIVTSAFHMPRSMKTFERAGWTNIVAWPVDYRSGETGNGATWRLPEHLLSLDIALKEYLGILAYGMSGR